MENVAEPTAQESTSELDPVARRVIEAIAKTQGLEAASIAVDDTFEKLGFDSLDGLNIVFAVEEEFNVDVPDEAAQTFTSIREVVEALRPLVATEEA